MLNRLEAVEPLAGLWQNPPPCGSPDSIAINVLKFSIFQKLKRLGVSIETLQAFTVCLHTARPGNTSEIQAKVAELVDALDLGSSVARRESSSLSFRTN